MSAELITAVSAVVVALISAVVSVFTGQGHRKQALEEADLLVKLQTSMGSEAVAVQDLQAVLADRMRVWCQGRRFAGARVLLQLTVIAGALYWVALSARRIAGEDSQGAGVEALGILESAARTGAAFFAVSFVIVTFVQIARMWRQKDLASSNQQGSSRPVPAGSSAQDQTPA